MWMNRVQMERVGRRVRVRVSETEGREGREGESEGGESEGE